MECRWLRRNRPVNLQRTLPAADSRIKGTHLSAVTGSKEQDPLPGTPRMGISNAEKQRRFRARNLGSGGRYERLTAVIPIATKRKLERLASHYSCTLAGMIAMLIHERTVSLLNSLSEVEQEDFYSEAPVHKRRGSDRPLCDTNNRCGRHDKT